VHVSLLFNVELSCAGVARRWQIRCRHSSIHPSLFQTKVRS